MGNISNDLKLKQSLAHDKYLFTFTTKRQNELND
jgi:hypothetical protein